MVIVDLVFPPSEQDDFPKRRACVILLRFAVGVLLAAVAMSSHAGSLSPRRFVEVVDLSSPMVSPDGASVAFRLEQASIERNTYDCFWYVQPLDGKSPPIRIADGGTVQRDSAAQPLPASVTWSPDGRWIYFIALLDGRVDVWRAAADGSGSSVVTHDHADVREFTLAENGRVLKYRIGATREEVKRAELDEYYRGIRIDASVPVGQNLFRSGLVGGKPATQRLGAWFDRVQLLADAPSRWKAVDLVSGEQRVLEPSEHPPTPLEAPVLAEASPEPWKLEEQPATGRVALLVRVEDGTEFLRSRDVRLSVLADANSQEPVECSSTLCTGKSISTLQWRPDSDELIYTVSNPDEGFAQSIYRWNVRSGQVDEVVRTSGLLNGGRDRDSHCGLTNDILVCVAANSAEPPHLVRIDVETGEQRVLFEPNAALAKDIASDMPVRMLRWEDSEGRNFSGQFYPSSQVAEGGSPLFVTYYVCPGFVRGGLGDEWPLMSLAERGISALCVNAAPHHRNAVERYSTGLSAIESVVQLLAAEGIVNPNRVGMGGLSFGTEVTLWTMMHSDVLAAASISSPGISRQYYLLGSLRGEAFFSGLRRSWQAGAPDETPERWKLLAPDMNLEKFQVPMLMQLPEQEYIHTLDFSIPLLRDRLVDMYVFPDEPHQKFQPRHKLAAYERNLDWFLYWLNGHEDADPAKAEQYLHWKSMRIRIDAQQNEQACASATPADASSSPLCIGPERG